MAGIMKRGLDMKEKYQVIERLAAQKSVNNPEFTPVRLLLKLNKDFFMTTVDVFRIGDVDSGNGRVRKSVTIGYCNESHFADRAVFVENEETFERYTVIPKTKHNMTLLSTHYGQHWDIENEDVNSEVFEMSKLVVRDKNLKIESVFGDSGQPVSHVDDREIEIRILREENATLKAREGLDKMSTKRTLSDDIEIRKLAKKNEELQRKLVDAEGKSDADALKDKAREIMLADEDFINTLKETNERYWITPAYRNRLNEEIDKLKGATVA